MKINKIILGLFWLATFSLGLCIGALEFTSALKDIKLTDVVSILLTSLGIGIAYYTYHQWFNNKKKEDSYLIAKKYLEAIDQVQEFLNELAFHYNYMCPAPGLVVEPEETSHQRMRHVNEIWHELYKAKVSLLSRRRELAFWNVSLTDSFAGKHLQLTENLNSIGVISTCLNNQLNQFFTKRADNIQEVIREKQMFDEKLDCVNTIVTQRISMGFEKIFTFK